MVGIPIEECNSDWKHLETNDLKAILNLVKLINIKSQNAFLVI